MKGTILPRFRRFFFSFFDSASTIKVAIALFIFSLIMGTLGYMLIEKYSFIEGLYMTVITISTVGFTEVQPLSDGGRLFTSIFIILNIGIFAYGLYAFTNYVIEGDIFQKMQFRYMNSRIDELKDHIIICGYGKYGQEISEHFNIEKLPFVVVDELDEKMEALKSRHKSALYVTGDASQDDVLLQAGIKNAKTLISALPSDTDNVFTVLTARQLNPNIKIISRAANPKSQKKLKLAGADHTIMPEQIGGFYMAALVTKPGAVEFFSFVTNEYESDIGFEEIRFEDVPLECQCRTIEELEIRKNTGCNIIGYKSPSSRYTVNPSPDTPLLMGSSFIVLGSIEQLNKLGKHWKEFAKKNQK